MTNNQLTTVKSPILVDFMQKRRSSPAKAMGSPGPSMDEIRQMAVIASRVPDHGKLAPWRFVIYSNKACQRLGELIVKRALELNPDLSDEMQAVERQKMLRSPTVIGLISTPVTHHPKVPVWEQELSCGACGLAWLIGANALGFDAQWLSEWIAFDEVLAPEFGCAHEERIAGFIHIGTSTMPKTERSRPSLDDILTTME